MSFKLKKYIFNLLVLIVFITSFPISSFASNSRFDVADERCKDRKNEIIKILNEENVSNPEFYYYLALAESTCKDHAVSKAGAKSMWQMMPWLIKNNDVNDWKKMTRIAGKYIYSIQKRLKHHYSDWITVASWNTGLHNLQKVCGRFPDEKCVRKNFSQATSLADLTNQWYKNNRNKDNSA